MMWSEKIKRNEIWLVLALIFTISILIFGKITGNYLDQDGLSSLDLPVNQLVVHLRTPTLNNLMYLITLTGNWQMLIWGSLLSSCLLIFARKMRYLTALIQSTFYSILFIEFAKNLVGRPRPPVVNALIEEHGFAFPSGHSYFAVVFYGLITYFWIRHFQKIRYQVFVFVIGSAFILSLAFSRIYLGVHWITDVLAGLSLSLSWLSVTIASLEYHRRYFITDFQALNHQKLWTGFWLFTFFWLIGLGYFYFTSINNLGMKIITPPTTDISAKINTAPAATSRGIVVSS